MTRKPIITSLLALSFIASIPVAAMAAPDFYGRYSCNYQRANDCPVMPRLTDEQRVQMDKLHEEHTAAVRPLRDALAAKRLELNALSRNPNVDPSELRQLTADITKLRTQIREVNDDFFSNMEKAGLPCARLRHHDDYGYGHGHGRGMHHAEGYGRHGHGGYGCGR